MLTVILHLLSARYCSNTLHVLTHLIFIIYPVQQIVVSLFYRRGNGVTKTPLSNKSKVTQIKSDRVGFLTTRL